MINSEEILVFSGNNLAEKLAWMMIGYNKWKLMSSGKRLKLNYLTTFLLLILLFEGIYLPEKNIYIIL